MSTDYVKTYTLDNAADGERDRLRLVEAAWDPGSIAHFQRLGGAEGQHVLMVAGGGGSLVEWITPRVGPTGRVLATDLDPRHLLPLAERYEQLDVLQHNIVTDPLPRGDFDLVHTRLLLAHLPERAEVIVKLAAALKPGGAMMLEDFDAGSFGASFESGSSEKVRNASAAFLSASGYDHLAGRRLAGWMRAAGLDDVDAHGSVLTLRGSSKSVAPMYLGTFRYQMQKMIDGGIITAEDAEDVEARYVDPDYDG